jgi:predicted RNase H-like HicB family nuclease
MKLTVIIEKAKDGSYSAHLPKLPGCVACGDTEEEVLKRIDEAAKLHIGAMMTKGEWPPPGWHDNNSSPPAA